MLDMSIIFLHQIHQIHDHIHNHIHHEIHFGLIIY